MKFSDSTACSNCKSTDTQSYQMAFESGTSSGKLSVGTYNPNDGFGIGAGKTSSQTLLAQKVQPPKKPEWSLGELLTIPLFSIIGFIAVSAFYSFILGIITGGLLGFAMWFVVNQRVSKEKPIFQSEYQRWLRSWICLRCGANWQYRQR